MVIAAPAVGYSFEPDRLSEVTIPVQLWEAQHDDIVEDSPAIVRRVLPRTPDHHLVPRASHLSFLEPCGWGMTAVVTLASWSGMMNICKDPDGFDRASFHQGFNRDVIAHFLRTLPKARD